jgi:3D-(3,5/4)-trihydroxycyclohexane-1,2-dione acylhydrolase (decyclizing)
MGAIGATGTLAANRLAHSADLVIGIGTRYSDFTSASMTAFQNPHVRFANINTAEFDAYKVGAIPVVADARVALEQLAAVLPGYRVDAEYAAAAAGLKAEWEAEVDRLFHLNNPGLPAQSEVIGAIWEASGPRDVLLSAAGSHPGDLHKLWRTRTPNGYHMEYGYSCMGYEIPGAMGAKMADPSREVYVFLGDGTYLMMPSEIVTSVQEGVKIIIVLVDNHGYASIGSLSRSLGQGGFGTSYNFRSKESGQLDGASLTIDFAANARSLGAHALKAKTLDELKKALEKARTLDRTTVIVVETDPSVGVPGYESWWDVAVAEVSEIESVRQARVRYVEARKLERRHL